MPRLLTLLAGIAAIAIGGCNQHVAVLDTTTSPTATPGSPSPQPGVASVVIEPGGVDGGESAQGTVLLTAAAATPGVIVSLSSNDDAATVPSVVVIQTGSSRARFGIATRRFPNDRIVVISASTADRTASANLEVWTIEAPVYFKYRSGAGDFVGGGGFGRFVPGTSTFSAVCDRNEVRILVTAPGSQSWSATFRGPGSEPLRRGFYEVYDTVGAGSNSELPGLDIRGQSRGCNMVDGRFIVDELDLRNNRVNLFRAEFRQRCEGSEAELDGEVRVENMPPNSSVVNCFR